jgi:hypothetical protein
MNVLREDSPVRVPPLGQVEGAECEEIRGHAEQKRTSPLPSGFPPEDHASPESMCKNVHVR